MKKIVLGMLMAIFLSGIVSASTTIDINSIDYIPSTMYPDKTLGTGSQLVIKTKVTEDYTSTNIKRTWLSWDESSAYPTDTVGCVRDNIDGNSIDYTCILTITPFMNGEYSVYIKTLYRADNEEFEDSRLVGVYDFQGEQFPQPSGTTEIGCDYVDICTLYKKECNNEIVGYKTKRVRTCETISYEVQKTKRVCQRDPITRKRTCENVPYTIIKHKRTCSYNNEIVPVTKKVCGYSDECAKWSRRRVC